MKTYYQILGIEKTADAHQIKSAFRKLAKKYHPDVSKDKESEMVFKSIREAYEFLSDEQSKKLYDEFLNSNSSFYEKSVSSNKKNNVPVEFFQEHEFIKMNSLLIFGKKDNYEYQIQRGFKFVDLINIQSDGINVIKKNMFFLNKDPILLKFNDIDKIELGEISGVFKTNKQLIFITKNLILGHSTADKEKFDKYCKTLSFYMPWFKI